MNFYSIAKDKDGGVINYANHEKSTSTAYSDRLWREDPKKHDKLCLKHFGNSGQGWANREPGKIEKFLSDFIGKPVILCVVSEYVNVSSGYPYWRFEYRYTDTVGKHKAN